MARLKGLCEVVFVIAMTVLVCTYIPSFYSEGVANQEVYEHLQQELGKIADGTEIDKIALQESISEEEFFKGISRETLKERILPLLEAAQNYQYVFTADELANIADDIIKVYEEEGKVLQRPTLSSYIFKIRIGSGSIALLSGLWLLIATVKKK